MKDPVIEFLRGQLTRLEAEKDIPFLMLEYEIPNADEIIVKIPARHRDKNIFIYFEEDSPCV